MQPALGLRSFWHLVIESQRKEVTRKAATMKIKAVTVAEAIEAMAVVDEVGVRGR